MLLLSLNAAALAGCGDDGGTDGGMGVDSGRTDSGGGTDGGGGVMCSMAQRTYLMDNETQVRAASRTCGTMCVSDPSPEMCFLDCLNMMTGGMLAGGCDSCIAMRVACVRDECLSTCFGGDSPECTMCQCGVMPSSCQAIFDDCAGADTEMTECTSS
jgi:hypothetical protein